MPNALPEDGSQPGPADNILGSPQEFVKAFKYRGFSDTAFLGTLGS
jgi:hypothetical protein